MKTQNFLKTKFSEKKKQHPEVMYKIHFQNYTKSNNIIIHKCQVLP